MRSVCFHPRLPMIISASEDGTVRLWHSTTYRPETTLNYGLERAWCIAATKVKCLCNVCIGVPSHLSCAKFICVVRIVRCVSLEVCLHSGL